MGLKKKKKNVVKIKFVIDERNETRCQKFIIYSIKRQSIEANKIISHNIYPDSKNQKIIIYYSYEDEITNENKKELGSIDISDFDLDNKTLKVSMKLLIMLILY